VPCARAALRRRRHGLEPALRAHRLARSLDHRDALRSRRRRSGRGGLGSLRLSARGEALAASGRSTRRASKRSWPRGPTS
jgi:hypothetical protein